MNKINHQILCTLFDYRYKTKFCLTVVQAHHSNRHGPKLITPRFWYISKIQISHKFLQKFQRLNTSRNRPRVQHTTDCAFIFLISPPSTNLHTTPPPKKNIKTHSLNSDQTGTFHSVIRDVRILFLFLFHHKELLLRATWIFTRYGKIVLNLERPFKTVWSEINCLLNDNIAIQLLVPNTKKIKPSLHPSHPQKNLK